jgi:hypothetical protein
MKVLLYTHGFAPIIGGAEKYVMLLAEGLARSRSKVGNIAVTVVTPTRDIPTGLLYITNIPKETVEFTLQATRRAVLKEARN